MLPSCPTQRQAGDAPGDVSLTLLQKLQNREEGERTLSHCVRFITETEGTLFIGKAQARVLLSSKSAVLVTQHPFTIAGVDALVTPNYDDELRRFRFLESTTRTTPPNTNKRLPPGRPGRRPFE